MQESEGLSLARLRKLSQPELLAYAVHKRAGGSWQDLAGLGQEQLAQLLLSSGRLRAQVCVATIYSTCLSSTSQARSWQSGWCTAYCVLCSKHTWRVYA